MEFIELFEKLSTVVQLALIIGTVTVIFLLACSRRAAENLALFLRELRSSSGSTSSEARRRKIQ